MPAFKYRQKNSLIVFERGHKAHGYVQTADVFPHCIPTVTFGLFSAFI